MTMPHLMNCVHSPDGWCLSCVKRMHERIEDLELLTTEQGIEIKRLRGKKCAHQLAREMSQDAMQDAERSEG